MCSRRGSFVLDVQSAITRHMKEVLQLQPRRFAWTTLSGTGSTSKRSLVNVAIEGSGYCNVLQFVIKQYVISDKPRETSIEQAEREYNVLTVLKDRNVESWHAPEPIAFIPEQATVIMGFCPGTNVSLLLWGFLKHKYLSRINTKKLLSLIEDIGKILDEIQLCKTASSNLPLASHEWYKSHYEEYLSDLESFGMDAQWLNLIYNKVNESIPLMLTDEWRCFQHTDLYFNNILQNHDNYFILDFPNSCIGTKYWDISHILVALEHYKLFRNVDGSLIDICKEKFLQQINVDPFLLQSMLLVHYCFAYRIELMKKNKWLKKIMIGNLKVFFEKRITDIIFAK